MKAMSGTLSLRKRHFLSVQYLGGVAVARNVVTLHTALPRSLDPLGMICGLCFSVY
jgi:hypothetical protein